MYDRDMTQAFQPTLFDSAVDRPTFRLLTPGSTAHTVGGPRTGLSAGAWVDLHQNWLRGAEDLLRDLIDAVPWRSERRTMYDRVVDVPRLVRHYGEGERLPHPLLAEGMRLLTEHYGGELGEGFTTAGLCYYRDGADSVAWHGDTIGRGRTEDTLVAILSLGSTRTLMLRPRRGNTTPHGTDTSSLRFPVGHGDLIVMGGSCQRTWEHCIPKSARVPGPRISVQFRPRGVR